MVTNDKLGGWFKNSAIVSGTACAACCLVPLVGLAIGIGGLGAYAFYVERFSMGVLAVSLVGLLFVWRASANRKKAAACSAGGCGCGTNETTKSSSAVAIACDLTAISSDVRPAHIENSRALFGSFQEARELPDGYAFRVPADDDSILRAARFISTERLCCPFFRFSLDVSDEGGSVWLTLTGGDEVKRYLRETLLAEGEVLSLNDSVRWALAV